MPWHERYQLVVYKSNEWKSKKINSFGISKLWLIEERMSYTHWEKNAIESNALLYKSMYIMDSNQYAIWLVAYLLVLIVYFYELIVYMLLIE